MAGKLQVGSVLWRGLKIYTRNFVPFSLLVTAMFAPLLAYTVVLLGSPPSEDSLFLWAVVMFFGGLALALPASATVAHGTFKQLRGEPAGALQSIVMGIKRLVPVLGVGALITMLVLLSLGAFLVPGIGLYVTYWLAVPVAVVEGNGVGASMSRSDKLTHGSRMRIVVILTLLAVVNGTAAIGLYELFLGGATVTSSGASAYLISFFVVTLLTMTLQAVVTTVAYHDLRRAKEGATVEDIAAIFD